MARGQPLSTEGRVGKRTGPRKDPLAVKRKVPNDVFKQECIRLIRSRPGWKAVKQRVPKLTLDGDHGLGLHVACTCSRVLLDDPKSDCQACKTLNVDTLPRMGEDWTWNQRAQFDVSKGEGHEILSSADLDAAVIAKVNNSVSVAGVTGNHLHNLKRYEVRNSAAGSEDDKSSIRGRVRELVLRDTAPLLAIKGSEEEHSEYIRAASQRCMQHAIGRLRDELGIETSKVKVVFGATSGMVQRVVQHVLGSGTNSNIDTPWCGIGYESVARDADNLNLRIVASAFPCAMISTGTDQSHSIERQIRAAAEACGVALHPEMDAQFGNSGGMDVNGDGWNLASSKRFRIPGAGSNSEEYECRSLKDLKDITKKLIARVQQIKSSASRKRGKELNRMQEIQAVAWRQCFMGGICNAGGYIHFLVDKKDLPADE